MPAPTVLLIHGAAITSSMWDQVIACLAAIAENGDDADARLDVHAIERPRLGDIRAEVEWLAPHARDAFIVGVSGGATLGLALAASDVHIAGALLHEPAVGSLAPGLLDPMVEAYKRDGLAGFGSTLYGPMWTTAMAPADSSSLESELAMFRAFEPAAPSFSQGRVTITVGSDSPARRHVSVGALSATFGYEAVTVPHARHFVSYESPDEFAKLIATYASAAFALA
jgi:pimeloyl-ACP methyl ester carboxylesterase